MTSRTEGSRVGQHLGVRRGLGEKPGSEVEKGTARAAFSGWGVTGEGPEGPVSPGETDVTAGAEQLGVRPAARGVGLARGWSSAEGAGQWGAPGHRSPRGSGVMMDRPEVTEREGGRAGRVLPGRGQDLGVGWGTA